ncbi:histidine phosphatase family protein [Brachybacterium sp. FME24]|uniref:histidine phosphatase family protein n=1 Tax=Brachybacterium sp. FME24 TaxID=2742605 RepID=UPI001865F443|nr:histidine phosphatase family protein [Brachybacterium sp. FME24]
MTRRTLYLARHGEADPLGALTDRGREQSRRLGRRLAELPIDVIWHSPLPRATESAAVIARSLPPVLVDEAAELIDHIPDVPDLTDLSPMWAAFFDGMGEREIDAGRRTARRLTARFATPIPAPGRPTHEVLITHAYQVAWMVRDALGAPARSWMSLAGMANTGLTIIEYDSGTPPLVHSVNDRSHLVDAAPASGTRHPDGPVR